MEVLAITALIFVITSRVKNKKAAICLIVGPCAVGDLSSE